MYASAQDGRPTAFNMSLHVQDVRDILTHIERDPKKQEKLINIYIERILSLWRSIMHHTPLGRNQPGIFIFHAFVVAALYQMKSDSGAVNASFNGTTILTNACRKRIR